MSTTTIVKFNVNWFVRVRLTEFGRAIYEEQQQVIAQQFNIEVDYRKKEDVVGWSRWQLHELMHTFGADLKMGGPLPFATQIELEVEAPT